MKAPDVILVPGTGVNLDGTLPEEAKQRVQPAVALFKRKNAGAVLMSGSFGLFEDKRARTSEAEAMKRYAVSLGVSPGNILQEKKSKDTLGNAYFCKILFLEPRRWRRVVVVTSEYHKRRTDYIFRKILGRKYDILTVGVPVSLSKPAREKKAEHEKNMLPLTKEWLEPIRDGDTKAVRNFIYRVHPGYMRNPKMSVEDFLKQEATKVRGEGTR